MDILSNLTLLAGFCFILGFALVIVEMFHPGFGFPGICGGILLVVGISLTAKNLADILIMAVILLIILGIMFYIAIKSFKKGRLSKALVLQHAQRKEAGYTGTEDLNYFLGHEGTAVTILRPAGTVDFDGVKVDVVSEGEFISKGRKVRVIKVEGRRIVVREIIDTK